MIAVFEFKKKQKKSCQNPSRIQKRTKQDFDRSSKKKIPSKNEQPLST
jgi:hypothetical protein